MEIRIIQPSEIPRDWYNSTVSIDVIAQSKELDAMIYSIALAKKGEEVVYIIPINSKEIISEINFKGTISYSELRILKSFLKTIKVVGYDIQFDLSLIKYQWGVSVVPELDILIMSRVLQLHSQLIRDLVYKINPSLLFIKMVDGVYRYSDIMQISKNIDKIDFCNLVDLYNIALSVIFPLIITDYYSDAITRNKKIIELEMRYLEYVVDTQTNGFNVDIKILNDTKNTLKSLIESKQNDLNNFAGKSCRVSSPKELNSFLIQDLGLSSSIVTSTGRQSMGIESLLNMKQSAVNTTQTLALDKVISLKESLNALSFLNHMQDSIKGNKLYYLIEQVGFYGNNKIATKGCVLNHMPLDAFKCLIPSHGNKFVKLSWSTVDFYTFCFYANCFPLIESYNKGRDLFQTVASLVFNHTLKNTKERDFIKILVYSAIYYYDAEYIANKLNCSVEVATSLRDSIFIHFPELLKASNNILKEFDDNFCVSTLYGRDLYLKQNKTETKEDRLKLRGNIIKAKVQGTVADLFKIATIRARSIDDLIYKYGFSDYHLIETSVYNHEDFFGEYISNFSDIIPDFHFKFKIEYI